MKFQMYFSCKKAKSTTILKKPLEERTDRIENYVTQIWHLFESQHNSISQSSFFISFLFITKGAQREIKKKGRRRTTYIKDCIVSVLLINLLMAVTCEASRCIISYKDIAKRMFEKNVWGYRLVN